MIKLFRSLFTVGETQGNYPESLIKKAIERAVEGTEPRLRAYPGYQKKLRSPVIHAIDHVVSLLESLPAPMPVSSEHYDDDPRLRALFSSSNRMLEVLGNDMMLNQFRRHHAGSAKNITALLFAEQTTRTSLGTEMEGNILRRDVAQTVVSFANQRLVDPAVDEQRTRTELVSRAFNHLLSLVLGRIAGLKSGRLDLTRRRALLRRKLGTLESGGWSFPATTGTGADLVSLQAELDDIEHQLQAPGMNDRDLRTHLDIAVELLEGAERNLWAQDLVLHLDSMNIQRDASDARARTLAFQELRNSQGQRHVALLVTIPLAELPPPVNFLSEAKKYLAY